MAHHPGTAPWPRRASRTVPTAAGAACEQLHNFSSAQSKISTEHLAPTLPGDHGADGLGAIAAVIVTHDRPVLLRHCLVALTTQRRLPDQIIVVDNASPGPETAQVLRDFPQVQHLRLEHNLGGAGGFQAGIIRALEGGAGAVWLMDDDGCPRDESCLEQLLASALEGGELVAPLVLDIEDLSRLAFPIRLQGHTHHLRTDVTAQRRIMDFAHLFNGALIRRGTFLRIGLPDPRYVIRGDEVEFLYRALRAGIRVHTETGCHFLHPSSRSEISPIMFGLFYAVEPNTTMKRYFQFRNRGQIFQAYGMWRYLLADIVRYSWFYIVNRRMDLPGLAHWFAATAEGWRGDFLEQPWNDAESVALPTTLRKGD